MPSRLLPETLNFIKQAERNVSLEGCWPVAGLKRLSETLNDTSGELQASLNFGSRAGFYFLEGTVQANLEVICQRCIEPMKQDVSSHFCLALMLSEEKIEQLPSDMEPCLVEGDEQSIIDVIEDELLLSLPMVLIHQNECSEFLKKQNEQRQKDKAEASPFAVLKDLKTD